MVIHSIGIGQPIRVIYANCKEKIVKVATACKDVAMRVFTAIADFFRGCSAKVRGFFMRRMIVAAAPALAQGIGPAPAEDLGSESPSSVIAKLTQYLPDALAVLRAGELRKEQVDTLSTWLQEGRWQTIIDNYRAKPEDLAKDGLKACERKLITGEQFATVTFCYSLMMDFPGKQIHIEPLFNVDGSVSEVAQAAIFDTMNRASKRFIKNNADLEETKLKEFFEKMRSEPKSEQFFLSVATEPYLNKNQEQVVQDLFINKSQRIMETLSTGKQTGFNVFHLFTKGEDTYRMMPSLGMMQKFLDTYVRKDDAVKISPVIGLPQEKDIVKKVEENCWQMRLSFPGVSLPEEIEFFKAPHRVDVMGYDFYHAYVCSEIPRSVRPACVEAAKIIKQLEKKSEGEYKILLQTLYEAIFSMNDSWFQLASDAYATQQDDPAGLCHFLLQALTIAPNRVVFQQCVQICTAETSLENLQEIMCDLDKKWGDLSKVIEMNVYNELSERNFYTRRRITEELWNQVKQQYFSEEE